MPLRGQGHSNRISDEQPYFNSLDEIDLWCAQPRQKLFGVLPLQPRPLTEPDTKGKLMVCHRYEHKDIYSQYPSELSYTFNFWQFCETFIYASPHRVTIPPSGWTNAAHKQGTKILGTLIFKGDGGLDCLRLILGEPEYETKGEMPLSRHYAILLAQIAHQRGFDGYLLKIDCYLKGKSVQGRALTAWILLLREELRAQVGPHAQVVWYDNLASDGKNVSQNTLNGNNLPFFLASDAILVDKRWLSTHPVDTAHYFSTLDPTWLHPSTCERPTTTPKVKTLQSIYTGVDGWGRSYGGAGFGHYRAISKIDPERLGLSVAFIAPACSWEREEHNPGWNWDRWWDYERKLWLGPADPGEIIRVRDAPEGPFKPIAAFFQNVPPPDPACFAFYTCFSPGVGYSWFVQGKKVLETIKGWTDLDKQCSIGNLVWPRPNLVWDGDEPNNLPVPVGSSSLDMSDGYNGGNSLKLSLTYPGSNVADAFSRSLWLPVQSIAVTTQISYEARVVCKSPPKEDVTLNFEIGARSLYGNSASGNVTLSSTKVTVHALTHGWSEQTFSFTVSSTARTTSTVAIGFVIGLRVAAKDHTSPYTTSMSLGQLAVYASPPSPDVSIGTPSIRRTTFTPTPGNVPNPFEGTLTWDTTASFLSSESSEFRSTAHASQSASSSSSSSHPAWLLHDTPSGRFPRFVYVNIYVTPLDSASASESAAGAATTPTPTPGAPTNSNAVFVGTTGLDGRAPNRFYVEPSLLPPGLEKRGSDGVRFYVQGVTDRGVVVPWERCGVVDWRPRSSSASASASA